MDARPDSGMGKVVGRSAVDPDIGKHVEVGSVEVKVNWCAFGCGRQMSARHKRESLWGGCKACENERLGVSSL